MSGAGTGMNRADLIKKVVLATELDPAAAGAAVVGVVNTIYDALAVGATVEIAGFGIFDVAVRPARRGRNPRTGETMAITVRKTVRFRASKALEEALPPLPVGLTEGACLERKRAMKLTPEQISEVKRRITAGEPKARVARDVGISRETVYQYLRLDTFTTPSTSA